MRIFFTTNTRFMRAALFNIIGNYEVFASYHVSGQNVHVYHSRCHTFMPRIRRHSNSLVRIYDVILYPWIKQSLLTSVTGPMSKVIIVVPLPLLIFNGIYYESFDWMLLHESKG